MIRGGFSQMEVSWDLLGPGRSGDLLACFNQCVWGSNLIRTVPCNGYLPTYQAWQLSNCVKLSIRRLTDDGDCQRAVYVQYQEPECRV
jgi:hypothetical protein